MNPFQQQNEMEKMCGGFSLTRMQRFYGFGICISLGFIISFCSTWFIISGEITAFAVLYTIGNIISIIGTGFLTGFLRQFKLMFDPTRLTATVVFIATLILTLIFAFAVKIFILTLISCIVQVTLY